MSGSQSPRAFRALAVVGAGNMGSGIAQKLATEGFPVTLVDLDADRVARGLARIEETLAQGVERRIFPAADARVIAGRIRGTARFEDLGDADLVVEAVFEDLAVKKDVFARLDRVCREDAVLATNTSSFSVAELAAATTRPGRVLGLHYFYHPAKNRLVEVVPTASTDASVTRRAWALQEAIGKTPIASRDSFGFIVNRFLVPWFTEAVRMVDEGAASAATIEAAAKEAFGIGMGPFELMNVTGLPIALHAATTLGRAFGPLYDVPPRLRAQVGSLQAWTFDGAPDRSQSGQVADRLSAVVWYVAAALVEEGVGSVEDTDIGARVGLRWRLGPFELMNRRGIDEASKLVADLAARWQLPVPDVITRQARVARPFSFRLVRSEMADGVVTLTVNRPDAMNALNEAVLAQLGEAFRQAAADPAVRGIVIAGSGKAFVAGADIRFFVRNIEARNLPAIERFTRTCRELQQAIETCPKPVVARVHGLALGGGVELALACHAIVASTKATLAFPETGIGIYPGLGGTQRTTRRVGTGLAKWLTLTGEAIDAEGALAIGLVDRVAPYDGLDQAVADVIALGPGARRHPTGQAPEPYRAIAEFFEHNDVDTLRRGLANTGDDPRLVEAMRRIASKAPVALRITADLIDRGAPLPIDEALGLELAHLQEIFDTRDAYEGLSSVGRRPPVFEGR
jgi:enoyl-CoA hydratase/3-hydroxyacyl-CoA dehydrogenase